MLALCLKWYGICPRRKSLLQLSSMLLLYDYCAKNIFMLFHLIITRPGPSPSSGVTVFLLRTTTVYWHFYLQGSKICHTKMRLFGMRKEQKTWEFLSFHLPLNCQKKFRQRAYPRKENHHQRYTYSII